ncbi:MAG: sugar phosphate isomerase/epimerase [Phycisphaerales bacterium]|nr:sugar phosphate isomerase/epimerase [Phycisphaerales bacterium]
MMKPSFSTVACPEWTLAQVAERAQANGFEAVELRTFGDDSTRFACDPALTGAEKVRRLFGDRGIEILVLATGVAFDEPVLPPVIGYAISDTERSVRAAQHAIDLAVAIECPFVRVFGFEPPANEKRATAVSRIVKRLRAVADHAHNTGIRVVIENGGAFGRAADLVELVGRCGDPLIGACYNVAIGHEFGDDVASAVEALGDRLWVARVKDHRDGTPCPLGEGRVPCERFVRALATAGFDGPLVFEWDRAWLANLAPAEEVLLNASARLWTWLGGHVPNSKMSAMAARMGTA